MLRTALSFLRGIPALLLVLAVAACGGSANDRAASHYERGVELAEAGDYVRAELEFRNALKLKSDFSDAFFSLGDAEEKQGNYAAAARSFLAVAEQDPRHVHARVRLAQLFLAAGQLEPALNYANQAEELAADDPAALTAKAAVQLKLDNRGEAVRLATAASKIDPTLTAPLMVLASERLISADPVGALSHLDQAAQLDDTGVGIYVLRLTALEAMGDQSGVEQLFSKLITLYPQNPAFSDALVKWLLSKGRAADAEEAVRRFAQTNAADDAAQLRLVAFLHSERGTKEAEAELRDLVDARVAAAQDAFTLRLSLAQLIVSQGDPDRALTLLEEIAATETTPANVDIARIHMARIWSELGDLEKAALLAGAVLERDAKNVDALIERAAVSLKRDGGSASAIDDLLAVLNEAPENAQAHVMLAQAYERDGSTTLALEHYAKALSLGPESREIGLAMVRFLLRYGRVQEARRALEGMRANFASDREVLTLLGQLRLAEQDWVGAQEIASTLSALSDEEALNAAHRLEAAALGGLERYSESIGILERSFSPGLRDQDVLPDLVTAYVRAGRQPEAAELLQSIVEDDPTNVRAQILLGSVEMLMERPERAEQAFADAAMSDGGVLGHTALAQFYLSVGRVEEAESTAMTGLERGESVPLRLLLAAILERQERFEDAIAEYERLYAAEPDSTIVANGLASLLSERRIGDKAALDRAYQIAQRFRNSEVPQYLDTLGWILYLRGDYASALPLLKTAAERLPEFALIQFHLGMNLKQLGQEELALETLRRAVNVTPPLLASDMVSAQEAVTQLEAGVAATGRS